MIDTERIAEYDNEINRIIKETYFDGKAFYENNGMKKYFQKIRENHKYLCIFGAGFWGSYLCKWLLEHDITVDFFCDNNEKRIAETVYGIPVLPFDELLENKNDTFVIVSATNKERRYNDEINNQLSDFPYKMQNLVRFASFCKNDYKLSYEYCLISAKKICHMLNDEKSKRLFLELLKLKFISSAEALVPNSLEKYYEPVQYFNKDYYKNNKEAVIVDCGAFDGDSMRTYLSMFQEQFKEYHCFEMDPGILPVLKDNIAELPESMHKRIYLHACGLSDKEGIAMCQLSSNPGGAALSETGECEVTVSLLDRQMKDKDVTMIKMDIEGAELKTLKGGVEVIKRNHPILAISIYHSTEQFFEIPIWILEQFPFYRLYLGLHTTITDDTVLYAVPKE